MTGLEPCPRCGKIPTVHRTMKGMKLAHRCETWRAALTVRDGPHETDFRTFWTEVCRQTRVAIGKADRLRDLHTQANRTNEAVDRWIKASKGEEASAIRALILEARALIRLSRQMSAE